MNCEITLDYFYCYNDVAVFPVEMIGKIPNFLKLISHFPITTVTCNHIVLARVTSTDLLTRYSYDTITNVDGMIIFNTSNKSVVYKHGPIITISILLSALIYLIEPQFTVSLKIDSWNFQEQVSFYVSFGFINPHYSDDMKSIVFVSQKRSPSQLSVLNQVTRLVTALKDTQKNSIDVIIPRSVASMIDKCLHVENEVSGCFYITRFTDKGDIVLGLNSEEISEGSSVNTSLYFKTYFSFHTHPENEFITQKAYLAWPSGPDMSIIANSFTENIPQIGHFVAGTEGLWIIKPTYELQALMNQVRDNRKCVNEIVDAISEMYTELEIGRIRKQYNPLERPYVYQQYLTRAASIKFRNLVTRMKSDHGCNFGKYIDSSLFVVSFVEWDRFNDVENNVKITFEYMPTPHIKFVDVSTTAVDQLPEEQMQIDIPHSKNESSFERMSFERAVFR